MIADPFLAQSNKGIICSHKNTSILFSDKGHKIVKCSSCNLVMTVPDNDLDVTKKYDSFYHEKDGKSVRFFSPFELIIKLFRFIRAFHIGMAFTNISLLDIGCGRGYTLYFLKKYFKVRRAVGTQISQPAYQFAKKTLNVEVYDKDLLELNFPDKTFNLTTLWHVLEHVSKPEEYVHTISRLLEGGGTLFFQVPNFDSWTKQMTGLYWLSWDVPFHLYHFDYKYLEELLKRAGFTVYKCNSFSFEFSIFISVQSIASFLTRDHNAVYNFLQKRRKFDKGILLQFLIFAILIVPCLLVNVLLYKTKKGEVLTIYAKRN
jgi:SAM-dependent methyltransferase